jgi:hypothetical protein
MKTIRSPKRRFELVLQGIKSQNTSSTDTAVNAFPKTSVLGAWKDKLSARQITPLECPTVFQQCILHIVTFLVECHRC